MNVANQTYGKGPPASHGEMDPQPPEPLRWAPNPFANLPGRFPACRGAYTSTTELFREAGRLWGTSQKCKELPKLPAAKGAANPAGAPDGCFPDARRFSILGKKLAPCGNSPDPSVAGKRPGMVMGNAWGVDAAGAGPCTGRHLPGTALVSSHWHNGEPQG